MLKDRIALDTRLGWGFCRCRGATRRRHFLPPLLLQLLDASLGRDHIRMFVGEPPIEVVERPPQCRQPCVDGRHGYRRRRRAGSLRQEHGGLACQFALIRIARLFGRTQLPLRNRDFIGELRKPSEIVRTALTGDAEVLDPEVLQTILGGFQALLVLLDLLVDEANGSPHILALVAQTRLDEYAQ